MKKRILFLSLVLSLLLTLMAPYAALAKTAPKPNTSSAPTAFTATADVMVTDPGHSTQRGYKVTTRGEIIEGTLNDVQNWSAMEDAGIKIRHNSVITLSPPVNGAGFFEGRADALIDVSPVGGGRLFGIYQATLYGEYMITEYGLVILYVQDSGTFHVAGRILDNRGVFVEAEGDWDATLILQAISETDFTLVGTAQLSGEYRELRKPLLERMLSHNHR